MLGLWKCSLINVENFVETVENLFFNDFDGQHTHYKGYILKMQDFLPKKRRFFSPKLWKNHFNFPKEIYGEKYTRKEKTGFPQVGLYTESTGWDFLKIKFRVSRFIHAKIL